MAPETPAIPPAAGAPLNYAPVPSRRFTFRHGLATVWLLLVSVATIILLHLAGRYTYGFYPAVLLASIGLLPILAQVLLLVLRIRPAIHLLRLFGFLWLLPLCIIEAITLSMLALWLVAREFATTSSADPLPITPMLLALTIPAILILLTILSIREYDRLAATSS
jgi:hypothetical protein